MATFGKSQRGDGRVANIRSVQTDAKQRLTGELGEDWAAIGELTDAEALDLVDMLNAAKLARAQVLDASIGDVLGHLPRLVRIPARKIVFG